MTNSKTESTERTRKFLLSPFGNGSDPHGMFEQLQGMLNACRFKPFASESFVETDSYVLEEENVDKPLSPVFEIKVDPNSALRGVSVETSDLELVLSVVSNHLKRYEMLARWEFDECPSEPWECPPERLEHLQSNRGMEFKLAVRVTGQGAQLSKDGFKKGKIISRKTFLVEETVPSFSFPLRWVDTEEWVGGLGRSPDAIWYIRWNETEDFGQKEVGEVLQVYVHKRAEKPLNAMDRGDASGVPWSILATEITTQIFAAVIADTPENELPSEEHTKSLVEQTFYYLADETQKSYSDIKEQMGCEDKNNQALRDVVAGLYRQLSSNRVSK